MSFAVTTATRGWLAASMAARTPPEAACSVALSLGLTVHQLASPLGLQGGSTAVAAAQASFLLAFVSDREWKCMALLQDYIKPGKCISPLMTGRGRC